MASIALIRSGNMCAVVSSSKSTYERISRVLLEMGLRAALIQDGNELLEMVPPPEMAFVEISCPIGKTARALLNQKGIQTVLLINQFQAEWLQGLEDNISGYIFLNIGERELEARVKACLRFVRKNSRVEEMA
jgi:DNA-binding response OmpR family regulator